MYVQEHPGRDPATVWLHHGVGSTRAWVAFLPAAAGGRRAIAYDRRGFGRSARDRDFTTAMFDEDVEDLCEMLTERHALPAHLIGHSDGGTVALLLAARVPELVLSVAVVAVHVRGDDTTVATLGRMGPPEEWPEPMRRSFDARPWRGLGHCRGPLARALDGAGICGLDHCRPACGGAPSRLCDARAP